MVKNIIHIQTMGKDFQKLETAFGDGSLQRSLREIFPKVQVYACSGNAEQVVITSNEPLFEVIEEVSRVFPLLELRLAWAVDRPGMAAGISQFKYGECQKFFLPGGKILSHLTIQIWDEETLPDFPEFEKV